MAPRVRTPKLKNVSGGDHVAPGEVNHGLGRSHDAFTETLLEKAEAQGLKDYQPPAPIKKNAATGGSTNDNEIGIPLQKELLDSAEKHLPQHDSNAQELIHDAVKGALRELLPAEAMLYVPPEDFERLRQDLLRNAEAMVKETVGLAAKHAAKLPITEESLRRSLRRDLASHKFRDRHHELYSAISRTRLPSEIGTARVQTQ